MTALLAAADLLLLLGATLRTVRLIVADDFPGTWLIRQPAQRWATRRDPAPSTRPIGEVSDVGEDTAGVWFTGSVYDLDSGQPGWRVKLVQGLSCPFCVGLWIAAGMVLILVAVGGPGHAPDWWRIVAGILTLNWVAAHLGVRAGDTEDA